ncbi:MAG: DUF4242 domain-containing protein [bacterium]
MPKYIIERTVGLLTQDQLKNASLKSNEVLAGMSGVTWIKSYYSEAEGKLYCEYEAPDPEAIYEHARLAGLPVDRISEVALEISPDMFQ